MLSHVTFYCIDIKRIECPVSVDGHDSKEDALACLDIMKQKVVGDVSKLQSQARVNTSKRRDAFLTDPDNVKIN